MRSVVIFALLTSVVAIRLRLEDEMELFEEEDPALVAAGVDEEKAFSQTVIEESTAKGSQLKALEMEEAVGDQSASVTLTKDANGAIQCENCRGDSSDMVKPFWRYSKKSVKTGGMEVKSFSVPANTHFWNAKETSQCMKDKYVLMLGDSTIVENLNDMILLLAGGPKKVHAGKFYQDVTHVPAHGVLEFDTPTGHMVNTYAAKNRNQTVEVKAQNLLVRYRFTGAAKLAANCGGLEVMLQDQVKAEIDQLVENGGRKPDAIILHSAVHDMCHTQLNKDHLSSFYGSIDRVGKEFVKPWVEQGINVIWRGAYRFAGEEQGIEDPKLGDYRVPAKMDFLAKKTMEKHGAKYVDTADLFANVHDESGCCSTIRSATTTFPHLGAVSAYHTDKAATFLSQLATFQVLDAICPAL